MKNNITKEEKAALPAVTQKIRDLMLNDMRKADIRESIYNEYPNYPLFEEAYSEAFTSVMG